MLKVIRHTETKLGAELLYRHQTDRSSRHRYNKAFVFHGTRPRAHGLVLKASLHVSVTHTNTHTHILSVSETVQSFPLVSYVWMNRRGCKETFDKLTSRREKEHERRRRALGEPGFKDPRQTQDISIKKDGFLNFHLLEIPKRHSAIHLLLKLYPFVPRPFLIIKV